jgi:hypothetical protein
MTSINRITTQQNKFVQSSNEQVSSQNEKADIASATQAAIFEQPKSSDFLNKALGSPASAAAENIKRELFTEANVNKFIQSKVQVEDQIAISQNLKPWIKSNFRLHAVQEKAVDNLTGADLQIAQKAAARATELKTKINVKFGDDSTAEEKNKLHMEEIKDSVHLRFSGCRQEMIQQLQEANIRNKQLVR